MDDFLFWSFLFKLVFIFIFIFLLSENSNPEVSDEVSRVVEVFCHRLSCLSAAGIRSVFIHCYIQRSPCLSDIDSRGALLAGAGIQDIARFGDE